MYVPLSTFSGNEFIENVNNMLRLKKLKKNLKIVELRLTDIYF